MRNTIAYEYEFNNLNELVKFVLSNVEVLIDVLKNAKQYSGRFYT